MEFSNTSTRNGLIQDCEFWTGLGDAGITGDTNLFKHFTRSINARYHQVVTMILESQDEWDFDDSNHTDYAVLTTPLVADQRDYVIPVSEKVLKIKRVDICYDGTGNTCYKAEPFDINEYGKGAGNDTDIDADFEKTRPFYDVRSNAIWIYPRADADNVTNSGVIRVEWTREIDEFTTADTTQEPGIDEPFHRMLSIGAAMDWGIANRSENRNDLAAMYADYENRLRNHYSTKQKDRNYILKSAYIDYS